MFHLMERMVPVRHVVARVEATQVDPCWEVSLGIKGRSPQFSICHHCPRRTGKGFLMRPKFLRESWQGCLWNGVWENCTWLAGSWIVKASSTDPVGRSCWQVRAPHLLWLQTLANGNMVGSTTRLPLLITTSGRLSYWPNHTPATRPISDPTRGQEQGLCSTVHQTGPEFQVQPILKRCVSVGDRTTCWT